MTQRISAQLSDAEAAALDAAVAEGRFPSRAAAVRAGLAAVLAESPPVEAEIVQGELVLAEPVPLAPARFDRSQALVLARRAALPLLGTTVAALAGAALRRRSAPPPAGVNVWVVFKRD